MSHLSLKQTIADHIKSTDSGRTATGRRQFLRAGLGAGSLALMSGSLMHAVRAQSGPGYEAIETPFKTRSAESVEVLEFFWFGCPHCYAFEPAINGWAEDKPDYVSFVREAPPLNPSWEQHSRAFYAAEALKVTDGFFDPMFNTIHQDRKPMRDPSKIASFVEGLDLGVSAQKFEKTMKSFTVETALRRSAQLAQTAGITGVPSIVINGKYRTGASLAGGHQGIINVIDTLAAQEHSAS